MNNPHGNKVIVFNGPPRCGKDAVKAELLKVFPQEMTELRFALTLKQGAHALLGLVGTAEAYNDCKDEHHEDFFGMKPRDFYIKLSEEFLKPNCGKEVFGHLWMRNYLAWWSDCSAPTVIVSDCGFNEELEPLVAHFGHENVVIIRMSRDGCDFTNDSRDYIEHVGCQSFDLHNHEGDIPGTVTKVLGFLEIAGVLASI